MMPQPLTAGDILRLVEAAGWEVSEATGNTEAIDLLLLKARCFARYLITGVANMLSTHIRHGDLVIDMDADGDVQIVRQSTGHSIRLSVSEWTYLMVVADLHGRPVAPPADTAATLPK